jgi:phage-related protein
MDKFSYAAGDDVENANKAFKEQVSGQVRRTTAELKKLEQLLSAGIVDRRVLTDFRDAVNRVRATSWNVECWLESAQKGEPMAAMLLQERVRLATQLNSQLAPDLHAEGAQIDLPSLEKLKASLDTLLQQLSTVL